MCIVTWMHHKQNYFLTHTRDERVDRLFANEIQKKGALEYLEDSPTKGTWMIHSSKYLACLLNGAVEAKGIIKDSHRSRGEVLFELENSNHWEDFIKMNFDEYSAFTLVVYHKMKDVLYQLSWDGKELDAKEIDKNQNHLWCSTTLYSKEEKEKLKLEICHSSKQNAIQIRKWHFQHKMALGKVHPKIKSVCLSQILYDSKEKVAIMRFFPVIL